MLEFLLRRSYTTGWYTLTREDAIRGLESSLLERKGVKNIRIGSCVPAQLSGDKGYEMYVSYQEDLDETFGFPENLDKVIFIDPAGSILPYSIEELARETQAGIVITTPSLKDDYYDVGKIFPQDLERLIERANKNGVQIVGITPSISDMQDCDMSNAEMMENSIKKYLYEHPSITSFLVINSEDMQDLAPHLIKGHDIPWKEEEKAREILNGRVLTNSKKGIL